MSVREVFDQSMDFIEEIYMQGWVKNNLERDGKVEIPRKYMTVKLLDFLNNLGYKDPSVVIFNHFAKPDEIVQVLQLNDDGTLEWNYYHK